jgi:hypothetical protein
MPSLSFFGAKQGRNRLLGIEAERNLEALEKNQAGGVLSPTGDNFLGYIK